MPDESALRPLTPRAECTIDGVYYTTLFEAEGKMSVTQEPDVLVVTTEGRLRSSTGRGCRGDVSPHAPLFSATM